MTKKVAYVVSAVIVAFIAVIVVFIVQERYNFDTNSYKLEEADKADSTENRENIPFHQIAKGSFSMKEEEEGLVVRSREDWGNLWTSLVDPGNGFERTIEEVDFTKDMVIAVFMGNQPSGAYSIEITRVEQAKKEIIVTYKTTGPKEGEGSISVLTQPYFVASIPKSNGKVRFVSE